MKVKITAVSRKDRVSTKTGKPFTSLGLKTEEHGEKWLSGFDNATTKDWKIGDVVELEVEQKGEYLNFKTARKDSTPLDMTNVLAAIAEVKHLVQAVGDRLERVLAQSDEAEELPFETQ